jgi:predicted negative regulator of RcsB-dependent stress response
MDEEVTIIDSNTRNEKILNFFINNKKNLIVGFSIILVVIIGYLSMKEMKERDKIKLANQFNITTINFKTEDKQTTIDELTKLINENDATYSPLALYFLIDNNLIDNKNEINSLFDELINETKLDREIKNLIIYKKALFNSDSSSENDLLQMLNPIINSESIWKSHSLYLVAEYFYSKNQKQKAKEFFNQIIILPNSNSNIKLESQKRLTRDFGE